MPKFRKKPVVIEAIQFVLDADDIHRDIANWAFNLNPEHGLIIGGSIIHIPTLEGVMTASSGDWIIQGVQGELYPCKPDIFEQTYEKVE